MSFDGVISGRQSKPRRILIYGPEGLGKSSLASKFPNPLFLRTEDGVDDLDVDSTPLITSHGVGMGWIGKLWADEHDYRTVVIDTVDWWERAIWSDFCASKGIESIDDIDFFRGYTQCLTLWNDLLAGLDALVTKRGMYVVLLGHSKTEEQKPPDAQSYLKYAPSINKHPSGLLRGWVNELLFMDAVTYVSTTGKGTKERAIAAGGSEVVVHTEGCAAFFAKNRLGLPAKLPRETAYDQYADAARISQIAARPAPEPTLAVAAEGDNF